MPGEGVREGLAWRGGVPRPSVSGQQANFVVSKRVQKEEKWRFLKDALWGGGTHRSWPGGLIPSGTEQICVFCGVPCKSPLKGA